MNPYAAALRCRAMGDYANTGPRTQPAPARYCSRCACKLRSDNTTGQCAPCRLAAPPPEPPPDPTREPWYKRPNTGRVCTCGNRKTSEAVTCHACYLKRVARADGTGGPVCPQCGGAKSNTARMCLACRYSIQRKATT